VCRARGVAAASGTAPTATRRQFRSTKHIGCVPPAFRYLRRAAGGGSHRQPRLSVHFRLLRSRRCQPLRLDFAAPVARGFDPPESGPWIDTTSLRPTGDLWLRPGEGLRLEVRAAPGATVRAHLADATIIPFLADSAPSELPWGQRAFGTDSQPRSAVRLDRYAGWWTGALGPNPGHVLSPEFPAQASDRQWMWLEAIKGGDTARIRWPLRLSVVDQRAPPVAIVNDDTAGTGRTDGTLAARPAPYATYHWFFPNGTRAVVSGRWNDQVRLQLSHRSAAWVGAGDIQPLPPGTAPPGGTTRSFRLHPGERSVTLRVPLPGRVPFRVDENDASLALTLYGVAADADWIQYGGTDDFVRLVAFHAPSEDETVVTLDLAEQVWGYRTRWEGNNLLLEVRRPPSIDPRRPLQGRIIALDAGHPPLGATGPTGVYEADVVLAVARKARQLFEEQGASVLMVRRDSLPLGLVERARAAEQANAEVLVSIHANALPDGVNPFVNNGTSVYYNHPRSIPLARAIDRALVGQFGFRDLGIGRGDLAMTRPTWMPAVLTEGLFLMIPEQEAVLASEEGQWRYARGVVEGVEAFLKERAREGR